MFRRHSSAWAYGKAAQSAAPAAFIGGMAVAACMCYALALALTTFNGSGTAAFSATSTSLRARVSSTATTSSPPARAGPPSHPPSPPFTTVSDALKQAAESNKHWRFNGDVSTSASSTISNRSSPGRALVAVSTANVWQRTESMLITLASIPDEFDLLVVDDKSTDVTLSRLQEYQVKHIVHDKFQGVTVNWNEAYQFFLDYGYDYLFIVNNDILVPAGAIEHLKRSLSPEGGNCDLVTPLSTIKGKGGWGDYESVERIHAVTHPRSNAFLSNPLNYQRVQYVLDAWHRTHPEQSCDKVLTDNPGAFSGFFFGVGRGIAKAAFKPRELFIASGVPIVGQEHDLWMRMVKAGTRGCLNKCSFVYHFKGQTIPDGIDRKKWVRADALAINGVSITHA